MPDIQDYPSRFNTPASKKFETFSYLPKLDAERIRAQVVYIVEQGWNPAIEHAEAAQQPEIPAEGAVIEKHV